MYALLLAALFLFGAAPAMANWELPGPITGLTADIVRIAPTSPATIPAATAFKNDDADEVRDVLEVVSSKVYLTSAAMNQIDTTGSSTTRQAVPLFQIDISSADVVSDDQSALVMYPLDTKFVGKKPSELTVVKVYGDGVADYRAYSPVYTGATIADGKFAIVKANTTTLVAVDEAIQTGTYYIAFCVKRDGNYDIGKADTYVMDPAFVYIPTTAVPVTGVTVSPATKVIAAGATYTLTATVAPANATNQTVIWSSSNTSYVTVDSATGVVTGVANGTSRVTATTADGGKTAYCDVTVGVPVTGVTVAPSTATIGVGGTVALIETVAPSTATNKTVTWSSSDTSVATVSSTGVVTGVGAGTATITVTTADGGKTATSTITVVSVPQPVTPGFQLPSGVENPSLIVVPSTVGESGLNSSAANTVGQVSASSMAASGTYLVLTDSVVSNNLAYRGNSMNSLVSIKMPVFKATVSAVGATGVVMFQLPASALVGYKAGHVIPVKAISTSASQSRTYSFVDAASKLADGKFGIVKSDRTTFMGAEEAFVSGATYYIVFAIKDGGLFDMNTADKYITDPTFVGLSTGRSSSGGGGCSTGAFAPAALLLALPLCALFFNRRR